MYIKFTILFRDLKTKSSFESHPFYIISDDLEEMISEEVQQTDNAVIIYGYYPELPKEPHCLYQLNR